MQTSGADMNSGSTNADAASVTQTNGSWDVTADTFIATAATPFSGVAVGEWVSIYNDGVTSGAVYVAQVTALYLSGLGVALSTTAKYGTKPASGATGKSAKVGGAWASLAVWTSLFPTVAIPAATRVNYKAGTYANTTTARTAGSAGLTTGPLWHRGYKTTIGDMDSVETVARVDGTDIPLFTWTTGLCTLTGAHQYFTNISFLGARTAGAQVVFAGAFIHLERSRLENTGANAASAAVQVAGGGVNSMFTQCWFKSTTTANRIFEAARSTSLKGCTLVGGTIGLEVMTITALFIAIDKCVFRNNGSHAIKVTTAPSVFTVTDSHIISPTSDGINFVLLPTTWGEVSGCLFANCLYGINNTTGANTNLIRRFANSFYNMTSGQENGFGDSPAFLAQTESSSPIVSSTDMTLVAGALALANGLPGLFENETYQSYLDIGAVQKQSAAGGGSIIIPRTIVR